MPTIGLLNITKRQKKLIRNWKGNLLLMLVSMRLRIIAFMDAIPIIFLFMKSSPFHPELLLKDVVKILHPDLLEGYIFPVFQ